MTSENLQAPSGKRRSGVGRKAILLFALVLALALSNVLLVRSMLAQFHHGSTTVNIAGKLRMLSQKTVFEAMALPFASPLAQQTVQDTIQEFDLAVDALLHGASSYGVQVQRLPELLIPHLIQLREEWGVLTSRIQPVLDGAANAAATPAGLAVWHEGLQRDARLVLRTAENLLEHIVVNDRQKQQRTLDQMIFLLLFDALVLVAAYIWVRRYMVTPLRQLAASCHALAAGDYQVRLRHDSDDEIGEVVDAFNQSADRIGALVSSLESKRKHLAYAQAMFSGISENTADGVYILQDGEFQYANAVLCRMLGYESAGLTGSAQAVTDIFSVVSGPVSTSGAVAGDNINNRSDCLLRRHDGSHIEVELFLISMGLDGRPATMGVVRDISERNSRLMSQRLAFLAYQNSSEAMMITDDIGIVRDVNPAFTNITGYTRDEIVGQAMRLLSSGTHEADFYREMWQSIRTSGRWSGEVWNRRKNGEQYAQRLVIDTALHDDGSVICHIGVFSDITKKKESEQLLWRQANYDDLTGLANRHLFLHHLRSEIARAHRKAHTFALLFLDLDLFKNVNDAYGHNVGDDVLRHVARRLQGCVRDTDMVARLGGDEFTIVLTEQVDHLIVERICRQLQQCLAEPFHLAGGHTSYLSVSLGVAFYPTHGEDAEALLRHADMAMYKAKVQGNIPLAPHQP